MSPKMKAPSFAWPVRIAAVHPVMAAVSDISFSVVYQHSSSLIESNYQNTGNKPDNFSSAPTGCFFFYEILYSPDNHFFL